MPQPRLKRRLRDFCRRRRRSCGTLPERVGYATLAHLRLRYPSSDYRPLHTLLGAMPEVVEAHHVTGDDCFVLPVR